MTHPRIDPSLVLAWQAAHSIARGSPAPVRDREGWRVDTGSESEVKRWTFPRMCEGVRAIGREIVAPRHYVKLCASDETLRSALPPRWEIQPSSCFMAATTLPGETKPLPEGYRLEIHRAGAVTRANIIAPDGDMAASGCAAETVDVFIYDRIETAQAHRRKGLGVAVMSALATGRSSIAVQQLLVATDDGRRLYETLGWTVLAPFATAVIPES
jgi:GNAT superfamily N-acetyltransferase